MDMRCYDISAELTVTVHANGTVEWSSASPVTAAELMATLHRAKAKLRERMDAIDAVQSAVLEQEAARVADCDRPAAQGEKGPKS